MDDLRQVLTHLTEAMDNLRVTVDEVRREQSEIKLIIYKQNLQDMAAGMLVDKDFCHDSHDNLECTIGRRFESHKTKVAEFKQEQKDNFETFKASVGRRLNWTWIIGICILGGYGAVIGFVVNTLTAHLVVP